MRVGMATTEQLQLKYSERIGQAPTEIKTELYKYVRNESLKIGEAKSKATKPGATQEDVLEYQTLLNNSLANLDAIATYSVNAAESQNIFKEHLNAVKTNANTGRLSNEALQNTDMISFDAALAANQVSGFKVYTDSKTGHVNMSYEGGKPRDIWAANEAFKSTGENLKSYVITEEQNITGSTYLTNSNNKIKDFKDLEPVKSTKTIYDAATNTEKKTVVSGVTNYEEKLTNNHMDFLLQETTASQFDKTWTQLQNLSYTDEKFNDIPWSTFTQADMSSDESIKKAIKNLSKEEIALADSNDNEKVSVEEYKKIQAEIRKTAARGLAKLYNVNFGQPVESTLTEQEVVNKYKLDSSGRQTNSYTDSYKQSFAADYNKHYTPAQDALDKAYKDGGAFANVNNVSKKDLMEFYRNNKELVEENYNITIGDGKNFMDQSTLIKAFNDANIPIPEDLKKNVNGIFVINVDDTGTFEGGYNLIADENRIKFDENGKITPEGKKNLFRTIGVEFDLYADANNNKLRKEASDYLPYNPMLQ